MSLRRWTSFLGALFLSCRLLNTGGSSKPEETPLERTLKNWKFFKINGLKSKKLKLYCNTAWPLYRLGDGEKWPENRSLNYNTILQLDLYCRKIENGLRFPIFKPSWSFTKTPLYAAPVIKSQGNQKTLSTF